MNRNPCLHQGFGFYFYLQIGMVPLCLLAQSA